MTEPATLKGRVRAANRAAKSPGVDRRAEGSPADDVLTVDEFCAAWKVSKDTFYHWRKVGSAPVCHRLPNGELRIARPDLNTWVSTLRDIA